MRRHCGFTLVEVLVALVLMSMLVLVLFAGFRAGVRSWQSAQVHIERVEQGRQFVAVLNRHVSQITPVALRDTDFFVESAFRGTASTLRYVAPLSVSAGSRDYLIEIASEWQGQAGVWVRFAPYEAGLSVSEHFENTVFRQVVEDYSLSFSYFRQDPEARESGWYPIHEAELPPRLIRMELKNNQGSWPPLVFAVHVRAPQ